MYLFGIKIGQMLTIYLAEIGVMIDRSNFVMPGNGVPIGRASSPSVPQWIYGKGPSISSLYLTVNVMIANYGYHRGYSVASGGSYVNSYEIEVAKINNILKSSVIQVKHDGYHKNYGIGYLDLYDRSNR
jgi:hypothetical protein